MKSETRPARTIGSGYGTPAIPASKFKPIHSREPIYSVRIGISWRALGLWEGDTVNWFWIGSHADYDKLIEAL